MLLHGFPEYWNVWRHQIADLKADYCLITPDLRGFNLSDRPEGVEQYSADVLVQDVLSILGDCKVDRVALVGHDIGGMVAWWLATNAPERIERLVTLSAPHPTLYLETQKKPAQRQAASYIDRLLTHGSMRIDRLTFWVDDKNERKELELALSRSDANAIGNHYRANLSPNSPFLAPGIPHVRCPTLVLYGKEDPYILPSAYEGTHEWVDGYFEIKALSGGHFLHHIAADVVSAEIRRWFCGLGEADEPSVDRKFVGSPTLYKTLYARRKAVPLEAPAINLKDPALAAREDYHALFSRLRTEAPIYWNPESGGRGFWAITRYDDIVRVAEDPITFSAAVRDGGMRIFDASDVAQNPRAHLLSMNPPQHTELRRTLQPLFTPSRVGLMEAGIRNRMTSLIDQIANIGSTEFVSSIAAPLTLGLLTEILGVPQRDADKLLKWSNAFIGDDDEDYQRSIEFRQQCVTEMDEYALDLLSRRRGGTGEDFVSLISKAKIDGQYLDEDTYTTNFGAFLVAGNETTRHALTAGILALSLFPEEKAKLQSDLSLISSAVKEIIRWATPLMHVRRTAMQDVIISGKTIKKGDKVVVWYVSGNRDERKWLTGMQFDVGRFSNRSAPPHLAFGYGPHHCLGWRMAELQIKIALEEMLRRIPDFGVRDPVRRLKSNFIGGFKELPIVYTPEQRL